MLDLKYNESNTQLWSIPDGATELIEIIEALSLFMANEANNTTMKTPMTMYSKKTKQNGALTTILLFTQHWVFLLIK